MRGTRISETLVVNEGHICCAGCGRAIAPSGGTWKEHSVLTTVPAATLPGAGSGIDPQVLLRRFTCPACGSLLDTETALAEDPFLNDIVQV